MRKSYVAFEIWVASSSCRSVFHRVSVDSRDSRATWDSQGCRGTRGLQGQWALRWVWIIMISKAKTARSSVSLSVHCENSSYFYLLGRLWWNRGAWTEGRTGKKQDVIMHRDTNVGQKSKVLLLLKWEIWCVCLCSCRAHLVNQDSQETQDSRYVPSHLPHMWQ